MARRSAAWTTAAATLVGCGHNHPAEAPPDGVCALPASVADAPATLAATGCFSATGEPTAGLRAYQVNSASWSNGAVKSRWLQLASGAQAAMDATGSIAVPVGSGAFKEFRVGDVKVETRLMMNGTDGWAGVTYTWNEAQNEATLSPNGGAFQVGRVAWTAPTRAECLTCHSAKGGRLLGLRYEQLAPEGALAPADGGQVAAWAADGTLAVDAHFVAPERWSSPTSDAPLAARARSYLAANCSFCHQPGGNSFTATDYRYPTALAEMGICDVAPTRGSLGLADARLLAPGSPARSVLSARIHSLVPGQMMPPLGRNTDDQVGNAVVDAWIEGLKDCAGP